MRIQNRYSHHWPNLIAHMVLGLVFLAMAALLCAFPIREIRSLPQWMTWGLTAWVLGLLMAGLGLRLLWEPLGYLQELSIEPGELRCTHFFGRVFTVGIGDILSCRKITTVRDHGSGNPCLILRINRFPFRLVLNLKGQSHRRAETFCTAINHQKTRRSNRI